MKKGDAFIIFKAEGAKEPARYLLAAPGSTVDPKLQAALKSVFPSNLVTMEWKGQNSPVVTDIRTIYFSMRTGTLTGTVIDRLSEGQNVYIEVKPDGRPTKRYLPNWGTGGGTRRYAKRFPQRKLGTK